MSGKKLRVMKPNQLPSNSRSEDRPKVVTIDGEKYELVEIWVEAWFGEYKGKRRVYALNPLEERTNP